MCNKPIFEPETIEVRKGRGRALAKYQIQARVKKL
jgi:hypothetical protein